MSASWDPDREGDLLGTEEFGKNIASIKEGFSRSRENTLLREKMQSLSTTEMKQAMDELDRKEAAEAKRKEAADAKKRQQSLSSKLQDELE
jgi:hypothetical protein